MKLSEYLAHSGTSALDFASRIGVSHTTIGRIAKGQIEPRRALRAKIVEATEGQVKEVDLLLPAEVPEQRPSGVAA